jgi:hypothetical protein
MRSRRVAEAAVAVALGVAMDALAAVLRASLDDQTRRRAWAAGIQPGRRDHARGSGGGPAHRKVTAHAAAELARHLPGMRHVLRHS